MVAHLCHLQPLALCKESNLQQPKRSHPLEFRAAVTQIDPNKASCYEGRVRICHRNTGLMLHFPRRIFQMKGVRVIVAQKQKPRFGFVPTSYGWKMCLKSLWFICSVTQRKLPLTGNKLGGSNARTRQNAAGWQYLKSSWKMLLLNHVCPSCSWVCS